MRGLETVEIHSAYPAALLLNVINQMCDADFQKKNKTGRRVARQFTIEHVVAMYEMEVNPYDLEE